MTTFDGTHAAILLGSIKDAQTRTDVPPDAVAVPIPVSMEVLAELQHGLPPAITPEPTQPDVLSQEEVDTAFATDEDEVEGDSGEESGDPDGEVKTSERWKGDNPACTVQNPHFVCPHPKCPSNKKPSLHQFKKRKDPPTEEPERKTEWGRYLFKFKSDHPQLDPHTAKVEARKAYVPKSGKKKSFQRIFAEKWKANNPLWREMKTSKEVDAKIREAFLAQV